MLRMIELNDGYHTPTFILYAGKACFKFSYKEAMSFLCGIHSPVSYKTISYEFLEDEKEISAFEILDNMRDKNDMSKSCFDLLWESKEGEIIEG